MNLIYCDSNDLSVNADNSLSCSAWSTVTEQEFAALTVNSMSREDFFTVGASIVTLFIIAFGVKMIRKTMNV